MREYPCKDCQQRKLACHGTCERYQRVKAERTNAIVRGREESKGLLQSWEMRRDAIERAKRKSHDRKERP